VNRDITERKRAEEVLRRSEEKYRLVVESSFQGINIFQNRRIVFVNPAICQIMGYSAAELMSFSPDQILATIHPEDRTTALERNRARLQGQPVSPHYEYRIVRRDGTLRWLETSTNTMVYEGEPALPAIFHDITERKRAEEALRASQQAQKDLVNSIVWEADAQTFQFSIVSSQAERLLDYPVDRWLNEPNFWANHIYPEDRDQAVSYCLQCIQERRDHEFEYRMVASDGRLVWLRDIVTVIVEHNEVTKLRGVMVDITAHKHLEEQLRQAQKLEAIGRLAGGIAHDFNNILTVIKGYAGLLLQNLDAQDPLSHDIGQIEKSVERAVALTRQLLAFSRKQVLQAQPLDLNNLRAS
jgi:two-component system, cell cycle sensor histidine kinase and response regulator CckA